MNGLTGRGGAAFKVLGRRSVSCSSLWVSAILFYLVHQNQEGVEGVTTGHAENENSLFAFQLWTAAVLCCFSFISASQHFGTIAYSGLIDWHYSWVFMEWWDRTDSTELMQQLYLVHQEWALFLVTTLKCCVFVCPSLFIAMLTVAYTHTDGYHSLGWRSNSPTDCVWS